MKQLWAPWRIEYILNDKKQGCIFCRALSSEDEFTLYKGHKSMVIMNRFPYINGHLLVAPVKHISSLNQLDRDEMTSLMATIDKSIGIMTQVMKPDGFNVGLNLGKVAGAGIEEHLHFHVVPRWLGDTNAFTVFAEVRVIPEHLQATYEKLKPLFDKLDLTL
ncbi:MAG: HIT domain-containing protein [Deltaproteobacteria bacterium]|nr:HIT domain-containing protein [Deltaproteobacteria bacterium]MBW1963087.1 HIT domain-containing protein [Deltaproteobacteria bacterium]MBW2154356.1 HIT domain-containing protein [Deltaproteobacteria bacterium]